MTSGLQVWYGRLTTRRQLGAASSALVAPSIGWLLLFLIVPCLVFGVVAFTERDPYGRIVWDFTGDNFERLAGFGFLGWTADYLRIFWRSIWVATLTTALCVLLAYPLAFFIAASRPRLRVVWMSLVVVPMCTNLVVRTYAWELVLSPGMPPAELAAWLGLVEPGEGLYPGMFAVLLGMIANALPFAVLPLYTSVERMDWSIVEAARDLYAGPVRAFFQAILPQTLPSLSVAIILTFVPALGMFVITDRLGGRLFQILGNAIQQQFYDARDYPFGSAISLVLVAFTLFGLYLYRRLGRQVHVL